MKKLFIGALLMGASMLANAQTVITNDYTTPTSSNEESTYERNHLVTLNHYLDFGKFNLSVRGISLKPNSFGFEWGYTMVDDEYGDADIFAYLLDLGPNYSYLLSSSEKTKLYLTFGLGPSFDYSTSSVFDETEMETKSKSKIYIDGYINSNLIFMYKRFSLSLGYYYRAPEFKFSKKDGAKGCLALGIGWDV